MVSGAAFLFASVNNFDFQRFAGLLAGTSLVIASSCVFNNLHDRKMDSKMERTKKRALVTGDIRVSSAVIFAIILGILGYLVLLKYTNVLTALIGLTGMFFYLVIYTPVKPRSQHATLLGSISGAVPPLAGYAASTNSVDLTAWMLFVIMLIWQMPHFYAIAIYRSKEYANANVPVLSVVKGNDSVVKQIIFYIFAFSVATICLYFIGDMSLTYLLAMVILGIFWLKIALEGPASLDIDRWAKKVFGTSLLVLLLFSLLISVNRFLP